MKQRLAGIATTVLLITGGLIMVGADETGRDFFGTTWDAAWMTAGVVIDKASDGSIEKNLDAGKTGAEKG